MAFFPNTVRAGLSHDHDTTCTDVYIDVGTYDSSGCIGDDCWWIWEHDDCSSCVHEENDPPVKHWAEIDIDESDILCLGSSATGYYEVTVELQICPGWSLSNGTKIGRVKLYDTSGGPTVPPSEYLEVVSGNRARAVFPCDDQIDFKPDYIRYDWGNELETADGKGYAASEFVIEVRCCTSGGG